MSDEILKVVNLKKYFEIGTGLLKKIGLGGKNYIHAVDDINFSIKKG